MYNAIYKMRGATTSTCTGVFTTKTPTDAYRGAGRPEATYAIERIIDELAAELGMDPLELREKNWITHEEFPYTTIAGLTYDSGNYEAATDAGDGAVRLRRAARRAGASGAQSNDPVQLGIGVSTFTEMCGLAPSRILSRAEVRRRRLGVLRPIRVLPTGKVEVVTGTSPHGQGHVTAWSQIAADALGVPFDDIEVIHGDTETAPHGMDTYGSRSLVVGGIAVLHAGGAGRREGAADRGAPARVRPGRPGVRGRRRSRCRGTPGADEDDPGGRVRGVHRARPARRHRADAVRPTRPSTRTTSPTRTARTCARSRSTPRPAWSTIRTYVARRRHRQRQSTR